MPRWSKDPKDRIKAGRGVLRKHAVSKVWYFHYRGEDRRWKSVTTGHRDRAGATDWALGESLELTRIEKGIIKPSEKVSNDTVEEAAKEWLKYIEAQRTAGTYRTYQSCVNNLEEYLKTRPRVTRLDQIDEAEILAYRDWLLKRPGRKRPNQKKTADNNLIMLRAFFNYCVAMKKMRANPVRERTHGVQVFFNERRPAIETYTRAEFQAILKHAAPDLARKCRILAASGLRIDELAHLEASDVDLHRGWLHVRTKVTHDGAHWTPKDKTDRKLPLNDELRAVINELLADGGSANHYLFPSQPGKYRAKNFARSTLKGLKTLAGPAGIRKSKLTSHNFRRYFVSQCADCGIDILCVMEWVGHDDWEMVRRYYRLRDEHSQSSMRRFTTGTPSNDPGGGGQATTPGAPSRPFGGSVGERAEGEKNVHAARRPQPTQAA